MKLFGSITVRIVLVVAVSAVFGAFLLGAPFVEASPAAGGVIVLAAVVVLATILSHLVVARPLMARVARLSKMARGVGKVDAKVETYDRGLDVGELSHAVADAHERILEHERLLKAQYEALRRKQINMAHDLRTPLTTLMLALENARDAALEGRVPLDDVRGALSEALYMTSLVQNLRIASRMDAGFATLGARSELDLCQVIGRVAMRFRLLSKGAGTDIDIAHPDDPVLVQGDDTMIEQMITNLMQNSLAYGGAKQQIILHLAVRDGRFTLDVLDEGPGIAEEAMGTITERWVRARPEKPEQPEPPIERPKSARAPSGHGLGLAIVSEIATVHGFELRFENREGGGLQARIEGPVLG